MGSQSKGCSSCGSNSRNESCGSSCDKCAPKCPPNSTVTADYVLVGLGTAGAPLARYLSEDLKTSVVVLEAGQDLSADNNVIVAYPASPPILSSSPKYSFVRSAFTGGGPTPNQATNPVIDFLPAGLYPGGNTAPPGTGGLLLALKQIWGYSDGRGWGGSSMHNGLQSFRSSPRIFDAWATLSGSAQWGYNSILPYLKAAETFIGNGITVNPSQRGLAGPIKMTHSGPLPLATPADAPTLFYSAISTAGKAGAPIPIANSANPFDYHDPTTGTLSVTALQRFMSAPVAPVNGTWPTGAVVGQVNPTRRSFSQDFLPFGTVINADGTGVGKRKLRIFSNATATKVLIERVNGVLTATGVRYAITKNGKTTETFTVIARKKVILCAGANVNPKLLQLSGVGPSSLLTSKGIPVLVDSPNVGINMQNHYGPSAILDTRANPPTFPLGGNPTFDNGRVFGFTDGSGANISQATDGVRRLQVQFTPGTAVVPLEVLQALYPPPAVLPATNQTMSVVSFIVGSSDNKNPNSLGSVRIVSEDPFAEPEITAGFYRDGAYSDPGYTDLHRSVDALRAFANINLAYNGRMPIYPPASYYPSAEYGAQGGLAASTRQLEIVCQTSSLVAAYHNSDTCRMGTSILTGVVDGNLDVFGVKGLSCCDCSVTPVIQDGNTAHAMYALGLKKAAIEGAVVPLP